MSSVLRFPFRTNWPIFIHTAVCLTTGPKPLPKPALHTVRSSASSFKWKYPLLSLRSSSSFLRLLPRLPVTSIPPFIFPSITRCRRQFLCKMWPFNLAFRLLISCRIFLCSLTLSNTSLFLTWSSENDRYARVKKCKGIYSHFLHTAAAATWTLNVEATPWPRNFGTWYNVY